MTPPATLDGHDSLIPDRDTVLTEPLDLRDRALTHRLDRIGRVARFDTTSQRQVGGHVLATTTVEIPGRRTVQLHQTVGPGIVFASTDKADPASHLVVLLLAQCWGKPSVLHGDITGSRVTGLTAAWIMVPAPQATGLLLVDRARRGGRVRLVELDEVLQAAQAAIRGDG